MDKKNTMIVILAVLVVISFGHIVINKYTQTQLEKENSIYEQGINDGINRAILQIMQQTDTCNSVRLHYNNASIDVVAIKCLNQTGGR